MSESKKADLASLKIDRSRRNPDRPRRKIWPWIVWPLVLAGVVIGYFWLKEDITPAMKVKAAAASYLSGSDAEATLVATGYVVAQRKAEVASKGTGRLVYLAFEEGDQVATDEVIAQIDNEDIKAQLDLYKANLMTAEADLENAEREFRRQQGLRESGSNTERELEIAETNVKLGTAAVAAAQASIRAAEVELENTYIRAPFEGTVLSKNADVGEVVAPFASSSSSKGSVVTLADMTSLEVETDVSEANIQKIFKAMPCEIVLDAYPETKYPGYVKKIVPTADRARATVLTKVAFDNLDERVLPEMSARVNFFAKAATEEQIQQRTVVTVPKEAITTREGQKVVFRINQDIVTQVPIEAGRELGSLVEILSGVKAGDRVVLSPPGKLATGQKIEISY